jgi:type I restriction enzyme M protein
MMNFTEKANFIWSVADILRGDFKQSEYGKVILPFTVLRRFDCVLSDSKQKILEMNKTLTISNKTPVFKRVTGHDYYNVSQFDFAKLIDDSNAIETNLRDYINGFSDDVKEILDKFEIGTVIDRLKKANLLYLVVQKFAELDLGGYSVENLEMGYMFEELIRRFSEQSNETAGEHFTPREVIELMVELLLDPDMDEMTKDGKVKTIFDPACGTGGMLSVAQNKVIELNGKTTIIPFGQELNPETYATCKSDMILKGNTNSRIVLGNSFSEDGFMGQTFDYMLSNPPFGVEWKKVEKFIKDEAEKQGFGGRFGAGTPRISDGSLLFLQHMISKMTPVNTDGSGGSRIAIVFNGSPLFTGDAGSGESEIRKWIIENDLLEAVVALPDQLFYNTGISTYVWVLTNKKAARRKGKIRLVNGVYFFEKMRKSLGNKRNLINEQNRREIVKLYSMFEPNENYIDFDNADFGYSKITVERPLYDKDGKPELDKKGNKKADSSLRDTEAVPLKEDINEFFKREVLPHVPDAWIDESKTKIGYDMPFTRYFYQFVPLRASADIMEEIKALEEKIAQNLTEVLGK